MQRIVDMLAYPLGFAGVSSVVVGIQSLAELAEDLDAWQRLGR